MRAALAVCSLVLTSSCGRHDTPVASYFPAQSTGGVGGTETGAAGDGDAGVGGAVPLAGSAGAAGEPALVCPDTYTISLPSSSSRYRHALTGLTWAQAELDCEYDGQHLIVISDEAENAWLAMLANAAISDQPATDRLMWIGAGDSAAEGEFTWVTGEPMSLSFWSPNEPNDGYDGEDCAEMRHSAEWNDDRCNAPLTYVCECDGTVSARTWCETTLPESCGDCATTCSDGQTCTKQQCL